MKVRVEEEHSVLKLLVVLWGILYGITEASRELSVKQEYCWGTLARCSHV